MILISVGILAFNQRVIGTRKNYTTVTGKSSQIALVNLKKGRTPISCILVFLIIMVSLFPLVTFALESLIKVPGDYSLKNLTLSFWIGKDNGAVITSGEPGLLLNPALWKALWNSIKLSVTCAVCAGTLGFLVGYGIVRGKGTRISKIVDSLAFFPYLMPAMAFSAIYLSMFSVRRLLIPSLYGSLPYL